MKEKLLKDVKQGLCRCGHVMEYHLNLDPAYEKCKYVKGSEEITKEKDVYKRVKKIYCGCEKLEIQSLSNDDKPEDCQ